MEKETKVTTESLRFDPGWHLDISNDDYHRSMGYSSSQIKSLIEKTPAHLYANMQTITEQTESMALGSLVHLLVLEPARFEHEFFVAEKIDKRTKAGKTAAAAMATESAGKTIITPEQYDQAARMRDSVNSHPIAGILLEDCVPESSVYWWYKSQETGDDTHYKTMLKVRPDAICRAHPVIIDLKTAVFGSYTKFIQAIQNYYYHVSAAMYLEGVNQCKPLLETMGHFAYTSFLFVVVENTPPYLTSVYELSPEYLDIGKSLYRRALYTLRQGIDNGWPGYTQDVRVIEPPSWANRGFIV